MMARARSERGSSLAWAMLVLAVVATAIAVSGGELARRMRLQRLATEAAALEDLRASAVAVGRQRAASPSWPGPETLELEGGTATVRLGCDGSAAWLDIETRAHLTGRVQHVRIELPSHGPCPEMGSDPITG